MKRIAVVCERDRAYSRAVALGIAEAAAEKTGWSLEFVDNLETAGLSALEPYDGVLARISTDRLAAAIERSGLPAVDIYTDRIRKGFASVDSDQEAIGRLAAEYFLELRCKSFAFCGYDGIGYSDRRFAAFSERLHAAGFPCNRFAAPRKAVDEFGATIMKKESVGLGSDAPLLAEWLKSLPPRTAVFCCHDVRAWQAISLCRAAEIDVPRTLAILGVDNDELVCSFTSPAISSIDNSARSLGRTAVDILSRMLADPKVRRNPPHMKVPPRGVCPRQSTAMFAAEPGWMAEILDHAANNVAKGVRVEELVAMSGHSASAVERAAKAATGRTLSAHILWTRLETAKKLLLFSNTPVSEVARLSGFSSPQYFCRFFKSRTGQTAERFRESAN